MFFENVLTQKIINFLQVIRTLPFIQEMQALQVILKVVGMFDIQRMHVTH